MSDDCVRVPEPFASAIRDGRAEEVCDAPVPTAASRFGRARARLAAGREHDAREDLEAAAPELGDACLLELAFLDIRDRTRLEHAREAGREIAGRVVDSPLMRARALHVVGLAEGKLRETTASLDALLEAAALYRQAGDRIGQARVNDTLGMLHASQGRFEAALHAFALSLVDKTLADDRAGMAITLGNLGRLHLRAGRFTDAVDCLERDLFLAAEQGDSRGEARVYEDLGRAYAGLGDLDSADQAYAACLTVAERDCYPDLAFFAHRDLCSLRLLQGDVKGAEAALDAARAAKPEGGEPYLDEILETARGELLLARGKRNAASVLEAAVEGLAPADLPDLEIPARILLARALVEQDRESLAERCLLDAVEKARRSGCVRYLPALNEALTALDLVEGEIEEEARLASPTPEGAQGGYVLRQKLGDGGFGEVYRAYDPVRAREVAYKRIALGQVYDAAERARLLASARVELEAASRVRHPGVARVHGVGRQEDGGIYVVQEYVPGKTLRAFMPTDGSAHPAVVAGLLSKVADALGALHDAGVVHRDLKPENVICRPDGSPVLVDFGVAHVTEPHLKRLGEAVAGTLEYIAPEQAQGKKVDGRADLYALGVVCFEWLIGFRPITPQGADLAARIKDLAHRAAPRLAEFRVDLSPAFGDLVADLLQKKPRARPRSAAEVASRFERLAGFR